MKDFIYRKHKKIIYEDESDLKYGLKQSLVAKKKSWLLPFANVKILAIA